MKTTHTHRGHCQVCGRVHAVETERGSLAKHGYTVEGGYFSGICGGSNLKPLEVDKTFTEKTIQALTNWIEQRKILLQDAIERKNTFKYYTIRTMQYSGVTKIVPYKTEHRYSKNYTCVDYTESNLRRNIHICNTSSRFTYKFEDIFDMLQRHHIIAIRNGISDAERHIKFLQKLIDEVHGKDLINVADAEKLLKDLEVQAKFGFNETKLSENNGREHYVRFENEVIKKTSIGIVGIKVSRPSVWVTWNDRVSVNCLLNGKRIARNKLIQKLQGDI